MYEGEIIEGVPSNLCLECDSVGNVVALQRLGHKNLRTKSFLSTSRLVSKEKYNNCSIESTPKKSFRRKNQSKTFQTEYKYNVKHIR